MIKSRCFIGVSVYPGLKNGRIEKQIPGRVKPVFFSNWDEQMLELERENKLLNQ